MGMAGLASVACDPFDLGPDHALHDARQIFIQPRLEHRPQDLLHEILDGAFLLGQDQITQRAECGRNGRIHRRREQIPPRQRNARRFIQRRHSRRGRGAIQRRSGPRGPCHSLRREATVIVRPVFADTLATGRVLAVPGAIGPLGLRTPAHRPPGDSWAFAMATCGHRTKHGAHTPIRCGAAYGCAARTSTLRRQRRFKPGVGPIAQVIQRVILRPRGPRMLMAVVQLVLRLGRIPAPGDRRRRPHLRQLPAVRRRRLRQPCPHGEGWRGEGRHGVWSGGG